VLFSIFCLVLRLDHKVHLMNSRIAAIWNSGPLELRAVTDIFMIFVFYVTINIMDKLLFYIYSAVEM